MSSTIAVQDLRVGMFVQLDGGWLSHPFPLSNFKIGSAEQIRTIRGLGLKQVRWVPEKSDLEPEADSRAAGPAPARGSAVPAVAGAAAEQERAAEARRQALAAQRERQQYNERQHAEAAAAWRQAFDAVMAQPQLSGQGSEQLSRAILDKMLVEGDIGITLVNGSGDRTAAHALNTTIISLLIARTLGVPEAELMDLGVGALMHDVGKLEVADRLRHVDESFGANELAAYRDHVAKGVRLGQQMGLKPGALQVLAQHHEHADGSGFPAKAGGERIVMGARVLALVNRYDNLCNPHSRSLALTPHEAVSVLFAQGRSRFDSVVLNAFIRMMGVYPAGSLVQLTDDRFAMVVGVNSSRPLKPRVLVHDPKVPRNEALVLDLEQHSDLGIRRSLPAAKLPVAAVEYLDPRPRVSYFFEPLPSAAGAAHDDVASGAAPRREGQHA
jgi:putative nucleotidyltransferase with HDIG domain